MLAGVKHAGAVQSYDETGITEPEGEVTSKIIEATLSIMFCEVK